MRAFLIALAAVFFCACSSGSPDAGLMLSLDDVLARPPAWESPGPVKVWTAERASDLGVYYVLSGKELVGPTRQAKAALRIVLLKGRAELRVGDVVKVSGSGAYAVAPPGEVWSLKRLGPEPLLFSLLVSPDEVSPSELLRPISPVPSS
ncbi:MAG: hypothetical protein HY077_07920 [Elusimicrobia bacterium]|nr:hypothetical protein [Elusimicrobiota bacterium]